MLASGRVRETCIEGDIHSHLNDWIETSPAILGEAALLADVFEVGLEDRVINPLGWKPSPGDTFDPVKVQPWQRLVV